MLVLLVKAEYGSNHRKLSREREAKLANSIIVIKGPVKTLNKNRFKHVPKEMTFIFI